MAVESTVTYHKYPGNGAQTEFDVTFDVRDVSEIALQRLGLNDERTDVLVTDFIVNNFPAGPVTVTYPKAGGAVLQAGEFIVIKRASDFLQEVDVNNNGGFFPDVVEEGLDVTVHQSQENRRELSLTPKLDYGVEAMFDRYMSYPINGAVIVARIEDGVARFDTTTGPTETEIDQAVSDAANALQIAQDAAASVAALPPGTGTDVATVLASLQTPTRAEFDGLNSRIDDLEAIDDKEDYILTADHVIPVAGSHRRHFIHKDYDNYTLTFPALATTGAHFYVKVSNMGRRALKLKGDGTEKIGGLNEQFLWPTQSCYILADLSGWQIVGKSRWLTGPTTGPGVGITMYVSPSGDDANDGLDVTEPRLTIQSTYDILAAEVDANGNGSTIQLANGTYTEVSISLTYRVEGRHVISIIGDQTTPSNVVLAPPNGTTMFTVRDYTAVIFAGMRVEQNSATAGTIAFAVSQFGIGDLADIEVGDFNEGTLLNVSNGGSAGYVVGSTLKVEGNVRYLFQISANSKYIMTGVTVDVDPVTITDWIDLTFGGSGIFAGNTYNYSGAQPTGRKYASGHNAHLALNGETLPGLTAGTTYNDGIAV